MSYHSIRDHDEPILKGLRSDPLLEKVDRLRSDVCYKRLKLDPEQMRATAIGESRSFATAMRSRDCYIEKNGHLVIYGIDNLSRQCRRWREL